MFRKFMVPGFNRRWDGLHYNEMFEGYTEGMYVTTAKFAWTLIKDLKQFQFDWVKNFKELDPWQKANTIRTLTEVVYITMAGVLAGIVGNLDMDDDEAWGYNMASYQLNRLYSELAFYGSPSEAFKILGSPAAGIDQAQRIIQMIKDLAWIPGWFEEIEAGKYKGHTPLYRSITKTIPLVKTIGDITTPEEKNKYWDLSN